MAQRIEHLTTDQKVGGSSPSERANPPRISRLGGVTLLPPKPTTFPQHPLWTELISLHVFKEAFGFGFFGTGQAQAVLMFLIIAVAAITQVIISKRTEVQR